MSENRPNIILIVCHDLGQHLGGYGISTVHSPNIDRLLPGDLAVARGFTGPTFVPKVER